MAANTNLESFILIWLDGAIHGPVNTQTQHDLGKLSNKFHPFDNTNACELFLQSSSLDERIVLIVSGRFGPEILPRIHTLEQISSIYVYCLDRERSERWAKNYSKIKAVVTTPDELIERIVQDNQRKISPADSKSLCINIYPNDQFIHSQLLIHHLLKMKSFANVESTLDEAEDRKEFQDKSFWWLTNDQSSSELITQAFQTKNIDLLYLTRFDFRDISEQLEEHQPSESIHAYHSHLLSDEEIEQLKGAVGKLISINRFLPAISQRDQALRALEQTTDSQKILFEIHADPSIKGIKPFADITSISSSKNPFQIIFMFGSIFRLDDLSQQNDLWICQMTLISDHDAELQATFEQIKNEDGDCENDVLAFGNMLARIHLYDDAEKYYQKLVQELSSNNQNVHICYRNLGNVAYLKKDYARSVEYHLQSLEVRQTLFESNHSDIADSHNCLGIVYFDQKNSRQAIDHYEKCLEILELNLDENHAKVLIVMINIALVYRMEENYSAALVYYQKIVTIEKQYLSEDHADLGQTYHNIAACLWCLGSSDQAMKYYHLSLEIKEKFLPAKDPSIAMTLENMGLIHENKYDFVTAFDYYKKAAEIYQRTLPTTHADVQQITENMLRVSVH